MLCCRWSIDHTAVRTAEHAAVLQVGTADDTASVVIAMFGAAAICGRILMNVLGDKFKRQHVLQCSLLLMAVSLAIFPHSQSRPASPATAAVEMCPPPDAPVHVASLRDVDIHFLPPCLPPPALSSRPVFLRLHL